MPPVVLERPKMSRAVWEALKSHILKERQRKKQELEADAEVERQRKERERQLKQDSMTLSETKEQISSLETRLAALKEEKHQLFTQLKTVLLDDDTRKKQLAHKEANEIRVHHTYMQQGMQMGVPPPMIFNPMMARSAAMYQAPPRMAHAPQGQPTLLQQRYDAPIKRPRSPSPPPSHNYKFGPFKPPPQALHSYPHKPQMPMQYYHTPATQPPPPSPHSVSVSYSGGHQPQPSSGMYSYSNIPPSRSPQNSRDEPPKHVPLYLHHGQSLPQRYMMPPTMEHPSQSPKYAEDGPKYYAAPSHSLPVRPPHLTMHSGLSIQSPSQIPQSGGITSGYPIRTTPSVSSYQQRPPSPHGPYAGQNPGRNISYGHPQHNQANLSPHAQAIAHSHPQVTISRYPLPHGMSRD